MSFSKIISGCTLALFVFASSNAFSGTNAFAGTFSANKNNTAGTSTKVMRTHNTHFCVLSEVGIEETDSHNERATCRVRRSGAVWILEAWLERSSDVDAYCKATCFTRSAI